MQGRKKIHEPGCRSKCTFPKLHICTHVGLQMHGIKQTDARTKTHTPTQYATGQIKIYMETEGKKDARDVTDERLTGNEIQI